jgi:hypothetical protein
LRTIILTCEIILFSLSFKAIAQISDEKDEMSSDSIAHLNRFDGNFVHSSNTYYWIGKLNYFYFGNSFKFFVNDQLNSTIIKSTRKYTQDIQNFNLKYIQDLQEKLNLDFRVSSIIFSDDRSIGINNASINSILGGIDYSPYDILSLYALGGWKLDNQVGVKDNGFSYLFESSLKNYDLDGYLTNMNLDLNEDFLSPRKIENRRISARIEKMFSESANETFTFQYRTFRKDFYITADSVILNMYNVSNNIEQRNEQILMFTNQINYNFYKYLNLSFYVSITNRDVIKQTKYKDASYSASYLFDQDINELKMEGLLELSADFGSFKNIVRFGSSERDEKHTLDYFQGASQNYYQNRLKVEKSKDNISKTTFLSLNSLYQFSSNDQLQLSGIIRILRYDTPSESNYDDRDELLYTASLSENHVFSRYLTLKNTIDLSNYHTVFIFGEQSANNVVNKIIRLQSQVSYRPYDKFRTTNVFEVLANYSIYDFEDKITSLNSLIFRQFAWIDSTSISFTKSVGLDFYSYLKFYERGILYWDAFKETPVDFLNDNTFSVILRYNIQQNIILGCGYKVFVHYDYEYNDSKKEMVLSQTNFGPTCKLNIRFDNYFNLFMDGWYETRNTGSKTYSRYANLNLNVSWFF